MIGDQAVKALDRVEAIALLYDVRDVELRGVVRVMPLDHNKSTPRLYVVRCDVFTAMNVPHIGYVPTPGCWPFIVVAVYWRREGDRCLTYFSTTYVASDQSQRRLAAANVDAATNLLAARWERLLSERR